MDANLIGWLIVLVCILCIPTAIWGFYSACVHTNRKNDFERERNKIRLQKMKAEAKLDLMLREWQQTKSLEDLARHRERLERGLDDMHGDDGEVTRAIGSPRPDARADTADDRALRMLGGATFGPDSKLILPSGTELSADEAQALTSAFSEERPAPSRQRSRRSRSSSASNAPIDGGLKPPVQPT